jgi:16S rRNA (cytosine1402-N4)-methyltransferase
LKNIKFHIPVLLNIATEYLINPEIKSHVIVDGTTGGGGYSELIAKNINDESKLICIDKDINALDFSRKRLERYSEKIAFVKGNFGNLKEILSGIKIDNITGIVLDLGLSEYQLTDEDGFSFMRDTLLDMRADKNGEVSALDIINDYSKNELTEIFENYGEIGNAQRLSDAIAKYRVKKKINSTFDLLEAINNEYRLSEKNKYDFYAKIFQAIRIAVNNEMENLTSVLNESFDLLCEGGRIVVISYHSLEDRIVKYFFKEKSFVPSISKYKKDFVLKSKKLKLLTKKAIVPERTEIISNQKSRSAKLRCAEIIWK